ncbi:MAG: NmrA family NAD(P)-binding protein [Pseudomonadales bacterium]
MTTNDTKKILIVGGAGKTGARVKRLLDAAGVETRAVSRSTSPAFDWTQPDNWHRALLDIDAAYLTYHPDLSVPEAAGHIAQFCKLAKSAGVKHVVLLSGRGEAGATNAERALQDSGLAWNIVQASWFAQNFSENFMLEQIQNRQLIVPAGCAPEPFIDIDDIAEVVVATLMEPGLHNRLFEVTGPACLTFAECCAAMSEGIGETVQAVEVPLADYLAGLRQAGVPDEFVALLEELFGQLFDGRNAQTATGVRQALGREATTFNTYVAKTAASGVWHSGESHHDIA